MSEEDRYCVTVESNGQMIGWFVDEVIYDEIALKLFANSEPDFEEDLKANDPTEF